MYKITIKYRYLTHVYVIAGDIHAAMEYVDHYLSTNRFENFIEAHYKPLKKGN